MLILPVRFTGIPYYLLTMNACWWPPLDEKALQGDPRCTSEGRNLAKHPGTVGLIEMMTLTPVILE